MSIVRVAPMPARACRESPPAGEPHLTRRPEARAGTGEDRVPHPSPRAALIF